MVSVCKSLPNYACDLLKKWVAVTPCPIVQTLTDIPSTQEEIPDVGISGNTTHTDNSHGEL